jgi:GxxExxY protein
VAFRRPLPLAVQFKAINLDFGYGIDIVVEDAVIVELRCVEHILPVHEVQLLTQLKLSGKRVGLILNFHVVNPAPGGIVRKVI